MLNYRFTLCIHPIIHILLFCFKSQGNTNLNDLTWAHARTLRYNRMPWKRPDVIAQLWCSCASWSRPEQRFIVEVSQFTHSNNTSADGTSLYHITLKVKDQSLGLNFQQPTLIKCSSYWKWKLALLFPHSWKGNDSHWHHMSMCLWLIGMWTEVVVCHGACNKSLLLLRPEPAYATCTYKPLITIRLLQFKRIFHTKSG